MRFNFVMGNIAIFDSQGAGSIGPSKMCSLDLYLHGRIVVAIKTISIDTMIDIGPHQRTRDKHHDNGRREMDLKAFAGRRFRHGSRFLSRRVPAGATGSRRLATSADRKRASNFQSERCRHFAELNREMPRSVQTETKTPTRSALVDGTAVYQWHPLRVQCSD